MIWLAFGMAVPAVAVDYLAWRANPSGNPYSVRWLAPAIPLLLYGGYYTVLLPTVGSTWSVHIWTSTIVIPTMVCWLLSFLLVPPPHARATSVILPALSTDQMREVDRLMVEQFGIQLLLMMENAGRSLALLAKQLLSDEDDDEDALQDRPIVVLAGRGNNGGGGLAAARHLLNWGAWVQIVLTHLPTDLPPGAMKDQLSILHKMGAPLAWAEEGWELPPADLVVDALIGYGIIRRPPRPHR